MPGQTQFTRMFSFPWCAAIARVIWMMAPLLVGYKREGLPLRTTGCQQDGPSATEHLQIWSTYAH